MGEGEGGDLGGGAGGTVARGRRPLVVTAGALGVTFGGGRMSGPGARAAGRVVLGRVAVIAEIRRGTRGLLLFLPFGAPVLKPNLGNKQKKKT